jgi:hypothetical protein
MPLEGAVAAAPLRKASDVDVCVVDDRLWLRGTKWNEGLDRSLRKILGAERFHRLPGDEIAHWGDTLPSRLLPVGPWTPLRDWLQPAAPATVLTAQMNHRASLRMVRSAEEKSANLLLVGFQVWKDYVVTAPQIRLRQLSFSASADGQALIRGEPLPPLPGILYFEAEGVARPLGWIWAPMVDTSVLRKALGLDEREVAMLASDGTFEVMSADDFVRATRSAVRLTEKEFSSG